MKYAPIVTAALMMAAPAHASDLDVARQSFLGYATTDIQQIGDRLIVSFDALDIPEKNFVNFVQLGVCMPIWGFTNPEAFKAVRIFEARTRKAPAWTFAPGSDLHTFCRGAADLNSEQLKDAILRASNSQ